MKDEYKIKVYLSKDVVEDIAVFDDDYPNLNKIFRESAILILDMSDENLDKCIDDTDSDFSIFCNRNNIRLEAQENILKIMLEDHEQLVRNCRSLFIMDISEDEATKLQNETGILILSREALDDNVFNKNFWRHRFVKDTPIQGNAISEWKNVLKDMQWLPTNSLILTDDYIFSESTLTLDECVENIKGLLDAILPDKLSVDFHVLISTSHPKNCDEKKRNQIVGNIKSYINTKRDYEVKIEFVFYKAMHQRKIITNYNIVVGDKGFANFSNKKKKVIDTNPTYACSVFQNIIDSVGDTEYGMATADLEDIFKISDFVKNINNANINDYEKRIVGDCKKDKSLRNRLINARS